MLCYTMEEFLKKYLLTLSEENKNFIIELKDKYKISFNKIINKIIQKSKENLQDNSNLIDNKNFHYSDLKKEIRIKITDDEYRLLKNLSTESGYTTPTKQARLILLNHLNQNKFYSKIELDEFIKTRSDINKVGQNLYQLLKALRERNFVRINDSVLEKTINEINDKIDELCLELNNIIMNSKSRI